ncbi:uncharacterized protein [Palaemon carinicauda]|uniref:uncharacterized protein n=1 Tax=Palaemon carinicauda TaxID=392227 RepID=UPI0035B6365D
MGYQILYLLLTIAVVTSKASPQPYEDIISQIMKESAEEEPTQNGTACPPMFSLIGGKCLYFASFVQQNQVACRQVCHSLEGELAAIRTATELQEIIREIERRGLVEMGFWIDGTFDGTEHWNFSNTDLVPLGTPFWYAAEDKQPSPTNDPLLKCASINKDSGFLMKDMDCERHFSPLCERAPVSLDESEEDQEEETDHLEAENIICPPFFVDISGNCIAFITWSEIPWVAAKQTCNAITSGSELLMTQDIELLRLLYNYLHEEGLDGHNFWIGATDVDAEGVWIHNGSEVVIEAPFWGNSDLGGMEPDGKDAENCLALTSAGQHYFRDKSCDEPYNPMCTVKPLSL